MGFKNDTYAMVWRVEPGKGNFTKVQISINRKMKDGSFQKDFGGFCMFIGEAHKKAALIKKGDSIKLLSTDVSNSYNKETKKEYIDFKVFDFELVDKEKRRMSNTSTSRRAYEGEMNANAETPDEGDGLPF